MEKKRIIWIDWAKVIGIMIVVFCHVPQYDTLEKHFLFTMQMPLFFMLSGYLHNIPVNILNSLEKYWKTLLLPYILFQVIFIPYFLVRENFDGLNLSDFYNSMLIPFSKCLIGIPLDGPTWFLYALFVMKILADIVFKSRFPSVCILLLCGFSIFLSYLFNNDSVTNISFTMDSMFDFLPFFFLGYYLKHSNIRYLEITNDRNIPRNIIYAAILLVVSLIILIYQPRGYLYNRLVFYIVGIIGSFVVINLCKCFTYKKIVETLSSGTIVILGIHWMFIGTINVLFEKLLHIEHGILYTTSQTVIIVLTIILVNYFIILFCKKHFRIILGGRK